MSLNPTNPNQPQKWGNKSRVIAQFVDKIPAPSNVKHIQGKRTIWEPQEGFYEALELAAMNPHRAMQLVKYDLETESMSQRKQRAKDRVRSLERQGYSAKSGWIVRAVDDSVFVMYQGDGY